MQYDIMLTYSMFTFSDRMLSTIKYRILRHQKTCSRHIKWANSIPVT